MIYKYKIQVDAYQIKKLEPEKWPADVHSTASCHSGICYKSLDEIPCAGGVKIDGFEIKDGDWLVFENKKVCTMTDEEFIERYEES